jgi:hypothetical protein
MRNCRQASTCRSTKPAIPWVAAVSILATMGSVGMRAANADAAQAKAIFKTMSDYLAAQKHISFDIDSSLEVVTTQQQKLALTSSGTVTLSRPNKLRATRVGGFSSTEVIFDGKKITILNKNTKQFVQVAEGGTIDDMVDVIRKKYGKPIPAADLLSSDVYARLMPQVVDVEDLGSGVIRGTECDHFAFRMAQVDVQIWIAHGARPYPCRYVITSTKIKGSPEYTIDISNWKTGSEVAPTSFSFVAPRGFKKVQPGELRDADELPDSFTPSK